MRLLLILGIGLMYVGITLYASNRTHPSSQIQEAHLAGIVGGSDQCCTDGFGNPSCTHGPCVPALPAGQDQCPKGGEICSEWDGAADCEASTAANDLCCAKGRTYPLSNCKRTGGSVGCGPGMWKCTLTHLGSADCTYQECDIAPSNCKKC